LSGDHIQFSAGTNAYSKPGGKIRWDGMMGDWLSLFYLDNAK